MDGVSEIYSLQFGSTERQRITCADIGLIYRPRDVSWNNIMGYFCLLTRATWTVNSTPIPTEAMRMTTGMALSLMPIRPMIPKSSTVIIARMNT